MGGRVGADVLVQAVAEFVVVEVHAGTVAFKDAVVKEVHFFSPDVEDAFASFVIDAPEVSVANFVVAVGQEDYFVTLDDAVTDSVADPDAVHVSAYVIAVPEGLPVVDADNDVAMQQRTDPAIIAYTDRIVANVMCPTGCDMMCRTMASVMDMVASVFDMT